jgi:hypothetical protein
MTDGRRPAPALYADPPVSPISPPSESPASRLQGLRICAGLALAAALLLVAGCDEVPGPQPLDRQAPEIVAFDYAPDSIVVADLPPDQVQDSVFQTGFAITALVRDPDRDVASVVFSLEPAATPQRTAVGTLRVATDAPGDSLYTARAALSLPTVREIYTLRVYAVDADSLTSNQAVGQVRVIPDE